MKKHQLLENQIKPGEPLNWHVFNSDDHLLLRKGTVVATEAQIMSLISRGAWYSPEAEVNDGHKDVLDDTDKGSPFEQIHRYVVALESALTLIKQSDEQGHAQIIRLAVKLINLYDREPDALIGAVHLLHEYDYSLIHSIHVAVLAQVLLPTLDYTEGEQEDLVCAALTCNLTLFPLQNFLQGQSDPLNDKQQKAITLHPAASAQFLENAGVHSPLWLDTVRQHHERLDGSGYPDGITSDKIITGAKLIAVADRYAAMVSKRAYRAPLAATNSLRMFFEKRGVRFDEKLSVHLVKQMGMYPPGACVRLANGETAIVIKRGKDPKKPIARAYLNPKGFPYADPFTRRCGSESGYKIKACVIPEKKYPINLTKIWGIKS